MADTMIEVRQAGSPIRRASAQRDTLIGLGLNKMGRTRELKYTRPVHGMIIKVQHMVEVKHDGSWLPATDWLALPSTTMPEAN